ncbi:hypothetical protein OPKNFCMD_6657 [Methylobacterium crusticola]|uniref:TRAP transporter small permease subunit n=1 Tax=Methylobacterium crusticola TaxID=1697972 RepID=A0ABQ4R835_9HYPH|nr:hypothetical protein [Methylobacterium crusticola]GJD53878.1 hypothetical protein OPKNFCMD_6657 [Methylobacterium crusticola]
MPLSPQEVTPIVDQPELAGASVNVPNPSLFQRAIQETKNYLAFTAYLLVVFGTLIFFSINLYSRLDQNVQHYPGYHFYALGLINALVLAKFMLLLEAAHVGSGSIGQRLRDGRLVYAIVYRSLLFAAVLVCATVLEEVLVGAWHGKAVDEVLPEIAGGPLGLIALAWVLFVALIPYFTYRELGRVLGEMQLRTLLLVPAAGRQTGPS